MLEMKAATNMKIKKPPKKISRENSKFSTVVALKKKQKTSSTTN